MREPFTIGALTFRPMPLPHDAAQVALVIEGAGRRAAIVTDLGEVPPGLAEHLRGCHVVLVESNHDAEMLRRGPYPAFLKRRVASARGHLSNEQAHALLRALSPETHTVALLHLSETNNRPDLALDSRAMPSPGRRTRIHVAAPRETLVLDALRGAPASIAREGGASSSPSSPPRSAPVLGRAREACHLDGERAGGGTPATRALAASTGRGPPHWASGFTLSWTHSMMVLSGVPGVNTPLTRRRGGARRPRRG